jgi:ribonuclease P protein component
MPKYPVEIRIRKKADYDLILARDIRVSDANVTIFGMRNQREFSRFGLIVSKKHGNAIKRNRRKRLLREAIRLHRHECPAGLDVVLIPRVGQQPTYEQDSKSLVQLMKKLTSKLANRNES